MVFWLELIIVDDSKIDNGDSLPIDENILYFKVTSEEYLEKIEVGIREKEISKTNQNKSNASPNRVLNNKIKNNKKKNYRKKNIYKKKVKKHLWVNKNAVQ